MLPANWGAATPVTYQSVKQYGWITFNAGVVLTGQEVKELHDAGASAQPMQGVGTDMVAFKRSAGGPDAEPILGIAIACTQKFCRNLNYS